jgi:glycosyltransferase involved in cell wall biosynthesis
MVHAIGSLDVVSMSKSFESWPTSIASRTKKWLYMKTVGRWDINRADAMHFTSRADMEASRAVGVRTPGYILPLGVDVPSKGASNGELLRERYPQIGDRKVVLFLGRLDPIKGLDILTEAIGGLAETRDDFVLVMAGGGTPDYERKVAAMVEDNGIAASTVMVGPVDGEDKSLLLNGSDVFVLPSYHENFPIAVLEAMASGLPVVVSDQAKIHDRVSDAGAGIVTSLDANEVAGAVERLLGDDELTEAMGEAGEKLVGEELSWEKSADRIVHAYEDMLAGGENAIHDDA